MSERIYVFKLFERFWHWSQAALILTLLITGFEVHGLYTLIGFEDAVDLHTTVAWTLVGLWIFAIFWHFTTGEWKQYIPTMDKVDAMLKYYLTGIFSDAPHPVKMTTLKKHNPLQRLAYLFVLVLVSPIIWITGWFYLFYASWDNWGVGWLNLEYVSFFHVAGAYLMLIFVIAHVYLGTAGHTPTAHFKAMITGYEDVD